jgi:hypothetical protein
MSNMKCADESFLAFRGLPEGQVLEILNDWKDWCASLTQELLADRARPSMPQGKAGDAISDGLFDGPEIPFIALPYAVRVGARGTGVAA